MYALKPDMRLEVIGPEALHELHAAVHDAGGNRPVVIDSDDLVARPEATMAAYSAAVELPFIPRALTWEPGERPESRRTTRWHADVSASSGFEQRERRYTYSVENSDELARFAAHQPFLRAAPRAAAHRRGVGATGRLLTEQTGVSECGR